MTKRDSKGRFTEGRSSNAALGRPSRVQVQLSLYPAELVTLDRLAKQAGLNRSDLVREMIRRWEAAP